MMMLRQVGEVEGRDVTDDDTDAGEGGRENTSSGFLLSSATSMFADTATTFIWDDDSLNVFMPERCIRSNELRDCHCI